MGFHSESAKEATRIALESWIEKKREHIQMLYCELAKYGKFKSFFARKVVRGIKENIRIAEQAMRDFESLKAEYAKNGLI